MPTASIARLTSSIGGRSRGVGAQHRAASSCHASGVPHELGKRGRTPLVTFTYGTHVS